MKLKRLTERLQAKEALAASRRGQKGLSAYEIWLSLGNRGTKKDFLLSLRGKDSKSVETKVVKEIIKEKVIQPKAGKPGLNGKSAYDLWLEAGNVGSITHFFESLKGDRGGTVFVQTGSVGAGFPLGGNKYDVMVRNDPKLAGSAEWKSSGQVPIDYTPVSDDYTFVINDELVIFNITTSKTATLINPTEVPGRQFSVMNKYTSTANISFSESLNGDDNFVLQPNEVVNFFSDGTEYLVNR